MKFRFFRIVVFIMAITVVLSACGSASNTQGNSKGNNQSTPTQQESEESKGEEAATTRLWTDGIGREVEIPVHPERIITTQYLPEMLALDVKPIGVSQHLLTNFTSVEGKIDGIENLGAVNELNVEKAMTLNPDLIIAMEGDDELIAKLEKIAPTVVVQWGGKDAFDHMKDTAAVLGISDKADQWMADYEQKVEATKAKLSTVIDPNETFGTVVIGGFKNGQLRVYADQNVGYTPFKALGFPMTENVKTEWEKEARPLGMDISMELLPEFASADRLIVVKFDNDPEFLKQVTDSSLWNNLPAVKNDKVYTVEKSLWFPLDVLSLEQQLDDLVNILTQ